MLVLSRQYKHSEVREISLDDGNGDNSQTKMKCYIHLVTCENTGFSP